jgi:hypothetical protein
MATISDILIKKYAQYEWTVVADDYNSLEWYPSNNIDKPTEEELRAFDAEVSLELRWDKVRNQRTRLLTACDWTQLTDSPLSTEQKTAWTTYRQQLRDIPQQQVEPEDVTWPSQPE